MSTIVEADAIHEHEIALAEHIRKIIVTDIGTGKFSDFELAGRLGCTHIGVEAMKTRKTWTLRYAISVASKLGYSIGSLG